jgi:excinuclease UvrABC nuclease subunit
MDNDEVVYVGMGTFGRAWTSIGRRAGHLEWLEARLPDLEIVFVEKGLSASAASALEKELIRTYMPRFNIRTKDPTALCALLDKVRPDFSKAIKTPFGRFKSIQAAADTLSIPRGTIANRVRRGKKGWAYAG